MCWFDTPTIVQLREMERLSRPYEANVPGGCGLFNIVKAGRPNFTPEVRAHTMRVAADGERFKRFRVHEVLVEGIRSATVQLFLNTAAFVLRPPTPTTAVRSAADACAWAAPRLASCGWTENELLRLHDRVFEQAKPRG